MQANNQRFNSQQLTNRLGEMNPASRPSELLPWADPTIARLVTKLQNEVRDERTQTRTVSRISGNCLAELEPPQTGLEPSSTDNDWDWNEEPRWSVHDEP